MKRLLLVLAAAAPVICSAQVFYYRAAPVQQLPHGYVIPQYSNNYGYAGTSPSYVPNYNYSQPNIVRYGQQIYSSGIAPAYRAYQYGTPVMILVTPPGYHYTPYGWQPNGRQF